MHFSVSRNLKMVVAGMTMLLHALQGTSLSPERFIPSSGRNSVAISIKVFLEGTNTPGVMTTHLNNLGLIPLVQPYSAPPLAYAGSENVTTMPPGIVDWVLVELREGTSPAMATTVIARRAGLLKSNGDIVDLDGTSPLVFNDLTVTQDIYPVVRHRNHIAIMAANPAQSTGADTYTCDMSQPGSIFGSGWKLLSGGKWGMVAANGFCDKHVNNSDLQDNTAGWLPGFGYSGVYTFADFNLDGEVNNTDFNIFWLVNFGISDNIP